MPQINPDNPIRAESLNLDIEIWNLESIDHGADFGGLCRHHRKFNQEAQGNKRAGRHLFLFLHAGRAACS
jgi:hypothetical protein